MNDQKTIRMLAVAGVLVATVSARALTFTYENPGVQATTVSGVITETFDSLPLGAFSGSIIGGLGSLSAGGAIVAGTSSSGAFGGAGNGTPGSETRFYAVGAQSGNPGPVTLTFTSPQKYFGMWWPAGDGNNTLSFFDGSNTQLGSTFTVANLLAGLPSTYLGNPNNGLDAGEKFVYLDFTATGLESIDHIVFGNNGSTGSGFELDNFSVTDEPITARGNPLPDGGSSFLMLGGGLALIVSARRGVQR